MLEARRLRGSVDQKYTSGLRSRWSGNGCGLSGAGTGAGPEPVPGAERL